MHNQAFKIPAPQLVHRAAYALAHAIPLTELKTVPELDHLCRVHACSAAAHLEPVTRAENPARGDGNQNASKTECDQGHPFDEGNTIWRKDGSRRCKACHRRRTREAWRAKNRPDLVGQPPQTGGRPRNLTYAREWPGGSRA